MRPSREATPVAFGANVPMFRGDPVHTGAHHEPGPAGEPVVRSWVDLGGLVLASPAVIDGAVYAGGLALTGNGSPTGALHVVDAATGAELWRVDTGPVFSSPAVVGGVVYVANTAGVLYAVAGSAGA